MCRNFNWLTLAALVVSLLVVGGLQAQTTTGRLIGTVSDSDGMGIPGVQVRITSDVLIGGPRATVSDAQGDFQFISLYPGDYTVKASLTGYVTQERQEVKVPLGGAASLIIFMPFGTFESEIEVVSETPVIDPTQVNTEQVFDLTYLQNSAIGSNNRAYQAVLSQTAGVTGGWNPNVFGSTDAENAFYIDGQDTTDPVTGTWSVIYNYDSIAEVELQTSGFEAEYGRATGGLVNVITKSGGNQFSGTADLRYRDSSFYTNGEHFDASILDNVYEDYAFTLGGPIVRDKLWFFAGYEFINSENTPNLSPTTRDWEGTNYNLKLTWQAGSSWRVVGKYSDSPADIYSVDASQWIAEEATAYQRQTTPLFNFELNGVLSDNLMWNTMIGVTRSELDNYPQSGDLEAAAHWNYDTNMWTHNAPWQWYGKRDRDDLATDLTWFVDELAGSHEFKGGVAYSATQYDDGSCSTGTTGGDCTPGSLGHRYQDRNWFGPVTPYEMWQFETAGPLVYEGKLWTAYVQDAWRVVPNLTLKLGLRYDQPSFKNDVGTQVADMSMLQPRIGAAWDITSDAKNVVRFNWGRFMHPNMLSLPSFLREAQEPYGLFWSCSTVVNYFWGVGVGSPEECAAFAASIGYGFTEDYDGTDPLGWIQHPANAVGTEPYGVDPNLQPTYADTLSIGYEREVGNRSSIEITYVDKKTRDVVEDTCQGNLGPDGPSEDADCSNFIAANIDGLARDYEGLMLTFETRSWSWLTLIASYTYSESKGNIEVTDNADSDFDVYPWHWENRYGFLSDHRDHRFKLNGFVLLPYDFTIGFDGWYSSAFTWEPREDSADNPDMAETAWWGQHFLEPRGSRDAFTAYNLDLQVSKGFTVANRVRLVLIGAVYNTFSSEYGTGVCDMTRGCGDYEMGDATTWWRPRSYEVGFRVEF